MKAPSSMVVTFPDHGITQVGEMARLGPFTELRVFHLHEVPDLGVRADGHVIAQMRKGADGRVVINVRVRDDAVIEDRHAIAEARVDDVRAAVNLTGLPDDGAAFD